MTATDTLHHDTAATRHDEAQADAETTAVLPILLTVFVLVAAWAGSFVMWGVPGLYIPAVAMVPVLMGMLVWISRG